MAVTATRFTWAAGLVKVKPNDNVLEIGCGTGLLAELITGQLKMGKFVAIDRSRAMLEKARKRNQVFIDRNISKFIEAEFSNTRLPHSFFDHAVAFNVNFFRKDATKELLLIKQSLKKQGRLYVFYQAPYEITLEAARPTIKKLTDNSFEILDTKLEKLSPTSAFCIIARPVVILNQSTSLPKDARNFKE